MVRSKRWKSMGQDLLEDGFKGEGDGGKRTRE
jgi:hypothetical protein